MDIPYGAEMQVSTVNKVRKTQNSAREVGVLQALSILEYLLLLCNDGGSWKRRCSQCSGASGIKNGRIE